MLCACIDIGTNTTRLLLAETSGHGLAQRRERRAFTGLGSAEKDGGPPAAEVVAEVARVVAAHRAFALAAGAREIRVVATAAVRTSADPAALLDALTRAAGGPVRLLDGHEEARLAFLGATRPLASSLPGSVGVVDVGGGSTELAVGTVAGGAVWTASEPIGSASLTRACVRADPPTHAELAALRERAGAALAEVNPPRIGAAVAVGGSAASLRRVVGDVLAPDSAERAVARLCAAPASEVARSLGLEPERARLLPASLLLLGAVAESFGLPLLIGSGGLREGVLLELAAGRL